MLKIPTILDSKNPFLNISQINKELDLSNIFHQLHFEMECLKY